MDDREPAGAAGKGHVEGAQAFGRLGHDQAGSKTTTESNSRPLASQSQQADRRVERTRTDLAERNTAAHQGGPDVGQQISGHEYTDAPVLAAASMARDGLKLFFHRSGHEGVPRPACSPPISVSVGGRGEHLGP